MTKTQIGRGQTRDVRRQRADEFLSFVASCAFEACGNRPPLDVRLTGLSFRLRYSEQELQESLFRSLQHLTRSESPPELDVAVWTGSTLDALLERSPWPVREAWDKEEILSVRCEQGFVTFDPQSEIISTYDRERRKATMWTPITTGHCIRVVGMPLAMIMNWWLTEHSRLLCHAAAIATESAGVLVAGPGGSGKSTLAFTSLDSNLRYLGDDFVIAQASPSPMVASIYNVGKLHPEHMQRCFPNLRADQSGIVYGSGLDKNLIYTSEVYGDRLGLEAPLTAIVVPTITNDARPSMQPISSAEAHRALAPSTVFQLPGDRHRKLSMLADLVKRVPTFRIQLCQDLKLNLSIIENFLNSRRAA